MSPVPEAGARRAAEASELARKARDRLAQRDFDGAEKLLGAATNDVSLRDYAALLLSQGKLDAAIAQLRVNLKRPDEAAQRRLAWMLRAKGDLAGALAAARLVKDQELVADLLAEMGEWKELAKLDAKADVEALADSPDGAPKLARIVIFRHLAGEKQACGLAAAAALKAWKQQQFQDRNLLGALALSDRVDQALEAAKSRDAGVAFELLAAQNQIREALRLVKIDVPVPAKFDWAAWLRDAGGDVSQERLSLALQVARTLGMAGEDQRAGELIDAMLAAIGKKPPEDGSKVFFALNLMQVQVALGRPEASDALAVKLLALNLNYQSNPDILISLLYRDQDTIAVLLWQALRKQFPAEDRPTALKHLRRLLTDKPDAKALEEAPQSRAQNRVGADGRGLRQLARRRDFRRPGPQAAGRRDALSSLWREQADREISRPHSRGGRLRPDFDRQGQPVCGREAVERGRQVLRSGLGQGPPQRVGRVSAGLGADQGRGGDRQGRGGFGSQADGTGPERSSGRRRKPPRPGADAGSTASGRRGRPATAVGPAPGRDARSADRAGLDRNRRGRRREARGRGHGVALAAGGRGTAGRQRVPVRDALLPAILRQWPQRSRRASCSKRARRPTRSTSCIGPRRFSPPTCNWPWIAMPICASTARRARPTRCIGRMLERHEALCRDFPRSATYHNDLAWLAANLDRDLDKALAHAQRAVELEPQSAGILDTLAEVQFRRGDRAEAVRLAKRCLEMDPEGAHYKKQLARFEAKPPAQK